MWLNLGVCQSAGEQSVPLALAWEEQVAQRQERMQQEGVVCSSLPENRARVAQGEKALGLGAWEW